MHRIFVVAKREFFETLGRKTFLFSVFFVPVVILGSIFFTTRGAVKSIPQPQHMQTRPAAFSAPGSGAPQQSGPMPVRNPVTMLTPFFFLFLMFMVMGNMNGQLLTSIIEEKSSRIMEVLLSTISPIELMAGKILGLFAVGLVLIAVWAAAALGAAAYLGVGWAAFDSTPLGLFIVYFFLGFFLFSGIFAAIGAACNTVKDAQPFVAPITIILIIPMMCWMTISQHPNGTLAVALSFIPLCTPMIMILRVASDSNIPAVQIAGSILLLCACIPITIWAASKIFRTGILMYGKSPLIREMLRWVKYK